MIEIFTDGSSLANGTENNEGGFAIVVYKDGKLIDCYQKKEYNTTNNKCEMKAILYAVIKYGKYKPIIYSDSAYAINSFTVWIHNWKKNNWTRNGKEIKNLNLIQAFDELNNDNCRLVKVKGHSNCEGNILADKLATFKITREEVLKNLTFIKK